MFAIVLVTLILVPLMAFFIHQTVPKDGTLLPEPNSSDEDSDYEDDQLETDDEDEYEYDSDYTEHDEDPVNEQPANDDWDDDGSMTEDEEDAPLSYTEVFALRLVGDDMTKWKPTGIPFVDAFQKVQLMKAMLQIERHRERRRARALARELEETHN